MSKANQKARFSVVNLFDNNYFRLNNMDRALRYLDYDEIINKIPTVKQALQDIKARKRKEKRLSKLVSPNRKAKKAMKKYGISDQIQRGFDIVEKWKHEEFTKEE